MLFFLDTDKGIRRESSLSLAQIAAWVTSFLLVAMNMKHALSDSLCCSSCPIVQTHMITKTKST
jgi:hypothetical protein